MTEASLEATRTRPGAPSADGRVARLEHLRHAIDHATHLLPSQGPITVFVHHNTLHAFEDLPFHEAVKKGARIFGCQPYLTEERFHQELARGRIRVADLEAVLREQLGRAVDERILSFGTRLELRLAMLQYPLRQAPDAELRWYVAETDALKRYRADAPAAVRDRFLEETRHWVMRDVRGGPESRHDGQQERRDQDALASLFEQFGVATIERWGPATWEEFSLGALWRVCRDGVHSVRPLVPPTPPPVRHRDLLREATGEDADRLVDDLLIRFCAAYLDQGFSPWPLPQREDGFFQAFTALYRQPGGPPDRWMRGLAAELERIETSGLDPMESVLESLEILGVPEPESEDFLTQTLLALRGWAGMLRQVEIRGDRVAHPIAPGSVLGYLAVRLILDRLALATVARETLGFEGPLSLLRDACRSRVPKHGTLGVPQRAFLVFQLAQVLGWTPARLHRLSKSEWATLLGEIEGFGSLERRGTFQEAYERRYTIQTLDALAAHANRPAARVDKPRFQTVHCIDEREESVRRHLEEVCPEAETFSVAGFYSTAMYYRGAADAHFVPLCPAIFLPKHWVVEDVVYPLEDSHRRRARTRRALGTASHRIHLGSRTFTLGALVTAGLGLLASIPLLARVLFPRLTARIRRSAGRLVEPPPITRLRLERSHPDPGPEEGHIGFTLDEMVDIAERVLRDIGLLSGFARLLFILGHGSVSLNNPHESAHDCGACGGSRGGPNGRALAQMLNDPRVREQLAERGIVMPNDTVVVGGMHNTCDDRLTLYDLDRLPKSHQQEFEDARRALEEACDRDAHERSRRFELAPLDLPFAAARRHVEGRSEDLAETRPEFGHASNSVCIVARRDRTRGLFLDRRAFLNSYEPGQDETLAILTRTLAAAVPVCAGISLEYYFSYVDNTGWGCGTKLPHNVAALLGVMNGTASDLRTGLPWQMVEIHEPVRLLFVVETTPEAMLQIMERNSGIGKLCRNGWMQLATLDPDSNCIHLFRGGRFEIYQPESTELPRAASSVEWYRGWRDHLGYAVVGAESR
jgi:uncharacterized protein YbcC (UPF0753/DUF2309 family)